MPADTTAIVALTSHARAVPAAERERFAGTLRRELGGRALVVETCHRVEGYVVTEEAEAILAEAPLPAGGTALLDEAAIRHAVGVAVGRDSVAIGEDQVLHQLRTAVDGARASGHLDPQLERLFALALGAGRRARSWRQGPGTSLADLAVAAITHAVGPVAGRTALVVGAGRMGRLAAGALARAGASIAVANRSADAAIAIATSHGGRVSPFDPGTFAAQVDAVIVALGGPWPISTPTIDALASGRAVVVDLSVPAAVPADLAQRLGARLVTADDLAIVEPAADGGEAWARRVDALVEETVAAFQAWRLARAGRAAADALVREADRQREAELEALWRRVPDLDPAARAAIEAMSRRLTDRILRAPLTRLGRDVDGQAEQVVREIFAL